MASEKTLSDAVHSHEDAAADGGPIFSRFMDDDIYRPLLVEFAADLPEHVAEVVAAVDAGDWPETSRLSHKLKGAAATYGYPQLAAVAGALEDLSSQHKRGQLVDDAELHVHARALESAARRVCDGTRLRSAEAARR
jgi:HPt (histidine-containing phosphotransfer) domain-containing protein